MKGLKRLANGQWNKDPGLYTARKIFFDALAESVELRPLGEFADFVNGTSYDASLLRDEGLPIIRISNITDPNSPHLRTIQDFDPRFHVQHGDLLVSWSASFKSILWPNAHGILNQHIFKVTERQGFDRDYLRHAIEYVFDDLQEKTVGIGMMHLRRQDFLGHAIPAPTLNVQQEIANYLTWLESGADGPQPTTPLPEQQRIVARVKALLDKVEEARRLREESADLQTLLGQQWRSEQFAHFGTVQLADIVGEAGFQNGYSPTRSETGSLLGLSLSGIRDGKIDPSHAKPIVADRDCTPYLMQRGDVFVVRGSGSKDLVGQAAIYHSDEAVVFPDLMIRIRLDQAEIDPNYFVEYWNSRLNRDWLKENAKTTSGIWKVSQKQLRYAPIPLPKLDEQAEVVERLKRMRHVLDALYSETSITQYELQALPSAILAQAFAGAL